MTYSLIEQVVGSGIADLQYIPLLSTKDAAAVALICTIIIFIWAGALLAQV